MIGVLPRIMETETNTTYYGTTIPNDSPNKQLKESYPLTGLGLDIGVK
jgi:hypothetical protein